MPRSQSNKSIHDQDSIPSKGTWFVDMDTNTAVFDPFLATLAVLILKEVVYFEYEPTSQFDPIQGWLWSNCKRVTRIDDGEKV